MRKLTKLSDEEIETKFDKLTGSVVCVEDLTFTGDTIEDFKTARKEYVEGGGINIDKDGVLEIRKLQVLKGTPRKDLVVIDLGEVRAVYLSNH